jgi:hypothetical protein
MNKTDLLFKLLAIPVIAVTMCVCTPKNTKDSTSASIPDSTPVDSTLDIKQSILSLTEPPVQNFFEYLGFTRPTYSEIKIWGWSKDGKVAYSNYISLEASDLVVIIFDIVNDTILWKNTLYLLADPYPYEEAYNSLDCTYYSAFINNFRKICVQNGIEFIQAEFKDLPIKHDNQTVNIILEKNETPLSSLEREDLLIIGGNYDGYKVIATHQGKKKIIKEKSLTVYADDVFLCGYFLSPFENRALIVIGEFAHSWEGSDVTYHFAGCHLSAGFR